MFDEDNYNMPFYDDNYECEDPNGCNNQLMDYDYDEIQTESLNDIFQNCVIPSIVDTAKYLLPLLAISFLFRLITRIGKVEH